LLSKIETHTGVCSEDNSKTNHRLAQQLRTVTTTHTTPISKKVGRITYDDPKYHKQKSTETIQERGSVSDSEKKAADADCAAGVVVWRLAAPGFCHCGVDGPSRLDFEARRHA
jgi:hypothetical protein